MSWPNTQIPTDNFDQGTDSPSAARANLLALINLVNQMIAEEPVMQDGTVLFAGTAGGTANALTGTLASAPAQLVDGMHIRLRAAAKNTLAPTLNLNAFGVIPIVKRGGVALSVGNIYGGGHQLLLSYHAAPPRWELLNPFEPGITDVTPGTYTAPKIVVDAAGKIVSMQNGSTGFSNLASWGSPGVFIWTAPGGVTKVRARVVSGGASGTTGTITAPGKGGGGGGYGEGFYTVTPGAQYNVVVGAGGAGNAQNGGTSSFGAFLSVTGGLGSGAGGTIAGAQLGVPGQQGSVGLYFPGVTEAQVSIPGPGGASSMGAGGQFGTNNAVSQRGMFPGGGGSGSSGGASGYGAAGCVMLEY